MDQIELKKNIAKYYVRLPEKAKKFFSDMNWMKILESISLKYRLGQDKIEILGTETTLVLLAIIKIDDYRDILEKELGLPNDIFNQLFGELQNSILNDNYKDLDQAFKENMEVLIDEKYSSGGKKIDERFNSLPNDVREAIEESDYQATLYTIAEKHKLTVEQMGTLEEITTKVMLGIIHPEKYEEELSLSIKIAKEDLEDIVNEVNDNILKKIRESLKKHWDDSEKIEKEIAPLPPYKKIEIKEVQKEEDPIKNDEEIPIPPYGKKTEENTQELTPKVEEKVKTPKNIIEEKLKNISQNDHTTTDYSVPKITDPYRESI